MNNWKIYEEFVIKYHQDTFNHKTYHWSYIPEELLYESGFINDTNKMRLQRKKDKEENKVNSIQEYGLDGIAYDKMKKIYYGIQAKCYDGKSYLKASDLGTFLSVLFLRMKFKNPESKGYLYHTCKLESNLYDDILINNQKDIIQTKLLFENNTNNINEEYIENQEENKEILRYYQLEAIEKLQNNWNGIQLVEMPCGTGKSTVIAHYLEKCDYEHIYIFSPLRIHAKQNLENMGKYVNDYEKILVDCDKDGTRDITYIKEKLNNKVLISSTYVSALDIIDKVIDNNKNNILIVDEAHNLYDDLIKVLHKFDKVILLTATPSNELKKIVNCERLYHYKMDKAIEDKFICDYRIYLPYLEDICEIPIEFNTYEKENVAKVMYLINGMLMKGCRRAIVYLKSVEECVLFNKIFIEVMEKYHGLPYWCERINNDTNDKERSRILKDFQSEKERNDVIHILSSVRILDEGVDIVKCDAVFICGGNKSGNEIRTLQRMCRANRLDINNHNKISHCFMWCNEWSESLVLLNNIKELDEIFTNKVSSIGINYSKNCNQNIKEHILIENEKLKSYITMKCKDVGTKQMERAIELVKRAKLREEKGLNIMPKSYTKLKNIKLNDTNNPIITEHNDYLFLYNIKENINSYNKNVIIYLNENLPDWDLSREDKTMNNIKKLVERYKIRGFPKCISMKNATTEDEKNNAFDYQLLQDCKKGKYNSNKNIIQYLDTHIENWRYKRDGKTLDELALNYAKEIVKCANIRKEKGLNFLPKHYNEKMSLLIKNNTDKEIIIEKQHYIKICHLRDFINNNSKHGRCSNEVIKYLDENLIGWRNDISLEEKALENIIEIVNRCKEREANGKRLLPKSYKKHLIINESYKTENNDYQKLYDLRKAYVGKGSTILYSSVKEYLDTHLPEWKK